MEVPDYPDGGKNYYESRILSADKEGGAPAKMVVRMGRLDDLLPAEAAPIALIKIDAEGHELHVVQGARNILRRDRPALVIEVEGQPDDPVGSAGRLFSLMREAGYEVFLFTAGAFQLRRTGDLAVDYFFLPQGHPARLSMGEKPGSTH